MSTTPDASAGVPQESFMRRCLQLSENAAGHAAPNPMVGAVLVHEGRIIGEGYHERYGGPHAEVHCLNSVRVEDRPLIPLSVLYVSLEPCAHFGKTPPCADRIIKEKVGEVVIGCRDPFKLVDGKGIEKLQAAGVSVHYPFLETECREANRRFFTFHQRQRSYIILKWAESADQRISGPDGQRISISGTVTNRIVHRWRSEEAAILVGTNTALNDDPRLSTRLWPGKNPVRLVLDLQQRLPGHLKLFDGQIPTHILTGIPPEKARFSPENLSYNKLAAGGSLPEQIARTAHELNCQSVLVEGGGRLLQSFIDSGCWDEIRRISSRALHLGDGVSAPSIGPARLTEQIELNDDTIRIYRNN